MNESLAATLQAARSAKRWSIRRLAEESGASTATLLRYLKGHDAVQPRTLDRITTALDLPSAVPVNGQYDEWAIPDRDHPVTAPVTAESPSVVTDGRTVLVLDVPPGFLDGLDDGQLSELKQDALVEILRLARAAKRGAASR